ncbi:DAK2 domain-containing protein [Clavibacter zhangzhiyongii]|uniref:DAK2 domain-containing protein n=1 Tax=Clavibacter zhangzhiyongii TaxID=2768071 RepID=UPI0039DF7C05
MSAAVAGRAERSTPPRSPTSSRRRSAASCCRGKAERGEKTMVDAWGPAAEAARAVADAGSGAADALAAAADAAERGAAETEPLVARKGRASYLGDRAIGHRDPGAQSSALILRAAATTARDAEAAAS